MLHDALFQILLWFIFLHRQKCSPGRHYDPDIKTHYKNQISRNRIEGRSFTPMWKSTPWLYSLLTSRSWLIYVRIGRSALHRLDFFYVIYTQWVRHSTLINLFASWKGLQHISCNHGRPWDTESCTEQFHELLFYIKRLSTISISFYEARFSIS